MKFSEGDIAIVRGDAVKVKKKYRGIRVCVIGVHPLHDPCVYTCQQLQADYPRLEFYETELETVFEHDKRFGLLDG